MVSSTVTVMPVDRKRETENVETIRQQEKNRMGEGRRKEERAGTARMRMVAWQKGTNLK